jgi:Tfp pilus assembly protein PilO
MPKNANNVIWDAWYACDSQLRKQIRAHPERAAELQPLLDQLDHERRAFEQTKAQLNTRRRELRGTLRYAALYHGVQLGRLST